MAEVRPDQRGRVEVRAREVGALEVRPDRFASARFACARFAPTRLAPTRFARLRLAPERFAWARFAVFRVARERFASVEEAPARFAKARFALSRRARVSSRAQGWPWPGWLGEVAPVRSAPARLALRRSACARFHRARSACGQDVHACFGAILQLERGGEWVAASATAERPTATARGMIEREARRTAAKPIPSTRATDSRPRAAEPFDEARVLTRRESRSIISCTTNLVQLVGQLSAVARRPRKLQPLLAAPAGITNRGGWMHRFRWPAGVAVLALMVAFGIVATAASSHRAVTKTITPSPVWTAAQLSAPAGDNWLEYYGSLNGNRYSSLNQITTSNVSALKQVWQMSLGTCTAAIIAGDPVIPGRTARGDQQPDELRLDGVEPGRGRRRALHDQRSAGPGLRDRRGDRRDHLELDALVRRRGPEQRGAVHARQRWPHAGRRSRRGQGLLRASRTAASSRSTRSPASRSGRPRSGRTRTTRRSPAPRSTSTAWSSPVTARATAAATARRSRPSGPRTARASGPGAPIPSPGQPGYKTWTNNGKGGNGSTLYGGGSFWESPIVDTNRNMLIVGTGNPEPWNSRGPGMNLYTDSIVALDLYTGHLKWYFQQVHHDLWDSDLPNNGVMFDGKFKVNGKMVTRPAVAYVNKVGMTFVLDRVTGKPLIPVKETPVPQNKAPGVNTWPTQPVPATQNVLFNPIGKDGIPCTTPTAVTSAGVPYATATAPDGKPYKIGCAYTPYDTTQYVVMPFEMMDWPASSYSPQTHSMITCGVTGRATAMEAIPAASQIAEHVRWPRREPPRRR